MVKFVRSGPKVLLVQPNYDFRAVSDDVLERQSVEQAFAQSTLAGFEIVAESDDHVLINFTSFLLQDAHGVARRLEAAKQGNYSVDTSRSALFLERTKNFPENTEFESLITLTGKPTGAWVRSVVPSPEAITVHMHHSLVQLPDDHYHPRAYDVRSGYGITEYMDFATPIDQPIMKRFINRHRLAKVDPAAAMSDAVEPIIYYLDPGTPEPIRSALIEGASWWNQAFEAAGYRNAFQVKVLPADADPMDVRYNLIQWVHRSTRGWSYGASVVDPRTGEIIKGQVSLGSLRARQDLLIAEGLLQPYAEGKPTDPALMKMVLARIRQLSAHEVGHTLGLRHNFASSMNQRASVMDYPHPLVTLDALGNIDLQKAYTIGIGAYDRQAIKFGYSDFAPGTDEATALDAILRDSQRAGLLYLTDQDARPLGGASPTAHLWDNGTGPAAELDRMMAIRQKVLANFSTNALRPGAPLAEMEDVLAPMYLFHRYQVDATSKVIGGLDYTYAVKGDGQLITAFIDPAVQEQALAALLRTLAPSALVLPENLLALIPPRPPGYPRGREHFDTRTEPAFDPLAAAETAADLTLDYLLHPARVSRLVDHHMRDAAQPALAAVLNQLVAATWQSPRGDDYAGEVGRVVDHSVLNHLLTLANNDAASTQARATALATVTALQSWVDAQWEAEPTPAQSAHFQWAQHTIERWLDDPSDFPAPAPLDPPDGSPIGIDSGLGCGI